MAALGDQAAPSRLGRLDGTAQFHSLVDFMCTSEFLSKQWWIAFGSVAEVVIPLAN